MNNVIIKYPVKHQLLRRYIKFFWTFQVSDIAINHKLIPQRNINLRFNLSDTAHYLSINGNQHLLEKVYFSGIHDHFVNASLKLCGNVDTLGICFYPDGFYPFINIPISEFSNNLFGADEVGSKLLYSVRDRLLSVQDIKLRLDILENELIKLLIINNNYSEYFSNIFKEFMDSKAKCTIADLCKKYNICPRRFERMFDKYIGVSANTYSTLNRFHSSMNDLLKHDFLKLSDLAYDNGYFDQMHFIKDFKRFTGDTPKKFIGESNSILHIGKFK